MLLHNGKHQTYKYPDLTKKIYFKGDKFIYDNEPYTVTKNTESLTEFADECIITTTYATNTNQIEFKFDVTNSLRNHSVVVKIKEISLSDQ